MMARYLNEKLAQRVRECPEGKRGRAHELTSSGDKIHAAIMRKNLFNPQDSSSGTRSRGRATFDENPSIQPVM
jgi:hypothetical protein